MLLPLMHGDYNAIHLDVVEEKMHTGLQRIAS